jgi:hypothetical protein
MGLQRAKMPLVLRPLAGHWQGLLVIGTMLVGMASAWDEKVSEVNVGGVLAHVKLGGGANIQNAAQPDADPGCVSLESPPRSTPPEWQRGIERALGAHLFTRCTAWPHPTWPLPILVAHGGCALAPIRMCRRGTLRAPSLARRSQYLSERVEI